MCGEAEAMDIHAFHTRNGLGVVVVWKGDAESCAHMCRMQIR